jgi:hypothetical protein
MNQRSMIHAAIRCVVIASIATMPISAGAQTDRKPAANEDVRSCRIFVQDFYDWYSNQTWYVDRMNDPSFKDRKRPSLEEILRHRPQLLSAKLQRLLWADLDLKRRNTDVIAGLEFDPFLNDGNGEINTTRYLVQNVFLKDNLCLVTFKSVWPSWGVRPELLKTRSGWIFVNIHYSFYSQDGKTKEFPDDHLIHILSR